jgi:hypothetical protein
MKTLLGARVRERLEAEAGAKPGEHLGIVVSVELQVAYGGAHASTAHYQPWVLLVLLDDGALRSMSHRQVYVEELDHPDARVRPLRDLSGRS